MKVLLAIRGLEVRHRGAAAPALAGVDLVVPAGGTVALVGESGCGKSTLARTLLGLHPPSAGSIRLRPPAGRVDRDPELARLLGGRGRDGVLDLATLEGRSWRPVRRLLGLVFQDPRASLNPWMPAWEIVAEPLLVHRLARGREARRRAEALLGLVGLPADAAERRAEAFSGGQCQRIALARALAVDPVLLVLDEAVAALDVSVQARILRLLLRIREQRELAWLFISHDLAVVRQVAARTAVMYRGRVVEEGPTPRLYQDPAHPYTRALLEAAPRPDPEATRPAGGKAPIPAPPTAAGAPPAAGCPYALCCPLVEDRCRREVPDWHPVAGGGGAACHLLVPAGSPPPA